MALRTFNGPGGPVVYDDGQPEERETPILPDPATEQAGIQDPWEAVGGVDAPTRSLTLPPGQDLDAAVANGAVSDAQAGMVRRGLAGVVGDSAAAQTPPAAAPPLSSAPSTTASAAPPPSAAVTPPPVAPPDAVSGADQVGADPFAPPPGPPPAKPADVAATQLSSGLVDPFGVTPEAKEEQRIAERARAAAALDQEEAQLEAIYTDLSMKDIGSMGDLERVGHQQDLDAVRYRLDQIGNQRTLEAQDQVGAAQVEAQKKSARRLAYNERQAAIEKQWVEAEAKKRTMEADALEEEANSMKIDRSWGGGSPWRSVMLGVMAAIAGFGSALKGQGDRNPALDIILRSIDQRVADAMNTKKEMLGKVAQARGRIDVFRNARNLSIDEAAATARAFEMKRTAAEIDQVAAQLPAAKKAAASEMAKQLRDKAALTVAERDKAITQRVKDIREQTEKERAAKAREKIDRSGVGVQWGRLKLDKDKETTRIGEWEKDYELRKAKNDSDIAKAEKEGNTASLGMLKFERDQLNREQFGLVPTVRKGPDGKNLVVGGKVVIGYEPIMEPDPDNPGKMRVWEPRGADTEVAKFRGTRSASLKIIEATDRLVQLIADNGWEASFLRSDAFQEAQQLYAKALLEGKEKYNLGSLQGTGPGGEYQLVQRFLGTTDPTALARMGDPTTGLRTMRRGVESDLYTDMTGLGYGGEKIEIPEDNEYGIREKVKDTPAGELIKRAEGRARSGLGSLDVATEYSSGAPGDTVPDPRSLPSRDAYDALQEAVDLATGRIKGNPEDGKTVLRYFVQKEQHAPVRSIAARFAYENDIDLGIDFFNEQAYAEVRSLPVEASRQLYGTDLSAGFGGTKEAREKRRGVSDAQARQDAIDILRLHGKI